MDVVDNKRFGWYTPGILQNETFPSSTFMRRVLSINFETVSSIIRIASCNVLIIKIKNKGH